MTTEDDTHRIAVIGASRGVGRAVVAAALTRGYAVTALARSAPEPPGQDGDEGCEPVADVLAGGVRWVRGDATDRETVIAVMDGVDAVVVTLGAASRDASDPRTRGTQVVLAAMREAGVRRLVVNSSLGVGDSAVLLGPAVRYLVVPLFMRRALDDHADQEGLVMATDLDWTILRPGGLTVECGGAPLAVDFTSTKGVTTRIARADVAAYAMDHLDDEATFGRTITLGTIKG